MAGAATLAKPVQLIAGDRDAKFACELLPGLGDCFHSWRRIPPSSTIELGYV
jgi:hypothetical protein